MKIYKRKHFEHSAKRGIFLMKLIFKTKELEHDFMISFEGMTENFKGTYPSARCITDQLTVQNTSIKDLCPSPFNPKFLLFKLFYSTIYGQNLFLFKEIFR